MRTASIRIRLLVIAVVVALSVWAIYPPDRKIKLGLDLKGGVHLVLRVKTDDALQRQTQATGTALNDLRRETVQQALQTIERRVNELGVAEPVVARYGDADQNPRAAPWRRRRRAREADHQIDRAAPADARRAGPFPSRDGRAAGVWQHAARRTSKCCPGGPRCSGADRHRLLRRPEDAGGVGQRPARRPAVGRRVQPARGGIHAETGCRGALRRIHRATHQSVCWRPSSTAASSPWRRSNRASTIRGRSRASAATR